MRNTAADQLVVLAFWGADPSSEMTVSWLSAARQVTPQVLVQGPDRRAATFGSVYDAATAQVDPGKPGGDTTITVTYYHAPTATAGVAAGYSVLESFQLTRPRHDGRGFGFGFGNDGEVRAAGR